jgi:hypothetical protein
MATLDTVQDYVALARTLLQDKEIPYRYPDEDMALGLSLGILEARRLRPDLFLPSFTLESFTVSDATPVNIDPQYRVALLYYVVGHVQLRDQEDTQDARANAFLGSFASKLTTVGV